jgi:hypothetical protein
MSEEFTLEQQTRNSAAVEREKGFLLPSAPFVDSAGYQLLACAGLTQQKYGGIARGNHFHKLQDLP